MFFTSSPMPWAALVAFAALGANLLGTALLILINPRSRAVRWHAVFTCFLMAWLALQGWFSLGLATRNLMHAYGWVVHILPAAFLAESLIQTHEIRTRTAILILLAAAATAPFLNPVAGGSVSIAWQAALWGSGAILHFRHDRQEGPRSDGFDRGRLSLKLTLLVIVPIAVIGVVLLSGDFLLYVMPLLTIGIQFLIFVGVVHHRFYDIEVRAARSGDIAAQGAEQERLALLGELSATLAHEIRNPLTGMRSLAQRLAGTAVDETKRTRYAAVILSEIERLERIVVNLLDVAKRSSVRDSAGAATELEPLFDDVLLLIEGRARRTQVTLERDAGGLIAAAPRDALAQSLLNLLINAVSHTPPGGRVRVTAVPVDPGRIEVRVADTGPGIPPEERERIFDPFTTSGNGVGLGLTVVRRLARELDWEVGVQSVQGGGSCFTIRLRAAP
jgi:signal transduction histidine kinase